MIVLFKIKVLNTKKLAYIMGPLYLFVWARMRGLVVLELVICDIRLFVRNILLIVFHLFLALSILIIIKYDISLSIVYIIYNIINKLKT